jgi:hypothetical protein
VVATPFAVAADSLMREPFPVELTDVWDVPLMRTEPRGTRLAMADTVAEGLAVAPLEAINWLDDEALAAHDIEADDSLTPGGSNAA